MILKFSHRQQEVGNIHSFFFIPEELLSWEAGQYLNLTMPDLPPVASDRLFTIASAPYEGFIQITTVVSESTYKKRMDILKTGDLVEADQLGGDFTWHIPAHIEQQLPKSYKRLFIAGGIGVTPYISIIRDRLHNNKSLEVTLLYAGKDKNRPFLNELEDCARSHPQLQLLHYNNERLTLERLMKDIADLQKHVIYLAGSQAFSEQLGEGLITRGFPRTQIKYDYFDGYTSLEY